MGKLASFFVIFGVAIFAVVVLSATDTDRQKKLFSLFSVVQFKNDPCRTTTSLSGNRNRNGTCFTSTECTNKGGSAQGNCAAGFGVCCLVTKDSCGDTSTINSTYIRNPGFPTAYTTTGSCAYTLQPDSNDICFIRLDFEQFILTAPTGASTATDEGICSETFVVTGAASPIPTLCGTNSGQHIYIEVNRGDSATVTFGNLDATGSTWDILTSQIPCHATYRPPQGCLQYHTGVSGRFTTFNFVATSIHLAAQQYAICQRREDGYCCIQYNVCPPSADTGAIDNNFSLDETFAALHDTECSTDYIQITGASSNCQQMNLVERFCGGRLNPTKAATENSPVCDCTAPFSVGIKTDSIPVTPSTASIGVCLEYNQLPCGATAS